MNAVIAAAKVGRWPFILAGIGAAFIWGTTYTATSLAFDSVPPITLVAIRFLIAAAMMGVYVYSLGASVKISRHDFWLIAGCSALGITLNFSLENWGVALATASDASLIVAAFPGMALLYEMLRDRREVTWPRFVGVVLAVIGVYFIVGGLPPGTTWTRVQGIILLLCCGPVLVAYNVLARPVVQRLPLLTFTFHQTVTGAVTLLPLSMLEYTVWQWPTPTAIAMILYLTVFGSLLAYVCYNYSLTGLNVSSAMMMQNLIPVFGVVTAIIVLAEPVTVVQLFGGAIVISGIVVGMRR